MAAVGRLDGVARSAWFAYGSILLIQAKVLWGIWEHRDLTSGDTTQYFIQASHWTHGFHLDPVWSPLYDFFWGSLRWFVDDPYASTILHRVLIVIVATVLVLAVLRRLLSPGIAWALAVWWAILPINYDVLYEVHLFALLPELLAVLIALTWTGLRMRAGVFGVLLAATVLVRNEVALALAVWTVAWVAYEVRATRRGAGTGAQRLAVAAGAPVLAIGAVTGALALSYPNGDLAHRFQAHEELSVCQAYAVGYQQRHDDFRANPFSGCGRLMARDFGKPMPSMIDAIGANPGAIGAHYLWNAQLLPYGLQLMLFDRISAGGRTATPTTCRSRRDRRRRPSDHCCCSASSSADCCCSGGTVSVGGRRGSLHAPGAGWRFWRWRPRQPWRLSGSGRGPSTCMRSASPSSR